MCRFERALTPSGDDETVWTLVKAEIANFEQNAWSFILDGYPRTRNQARYLFD